MISLSPVVQESMIMDNGNGNDNDNDDDDDDDDDDDADERQRKQSGFRSSIARFTRSAKADDGGKRRLLERCEFREFGSLNH